jgi:hypothetical protein
MRARTRAGGWEVDYSVRWRGREVESPGVCAMVAVVAIVVGSVGAGLGILLAGILIAMSLPLHPVLRLLGREGFLTVANGRRTYAPGRRGFRRRS